MAPKRRPGASDEGTHNLLRVFVTAKDKPSDSDAYWDTDDVDLDMLNPVLVAVGATDVWE